MNMIDAYKQLCYDGHFDIAISILNRYNLNILNVSNFHSICIFNGKQPHYDYCRLHNIPINYSAMYLTVSQYTINNVNNFLRNITLHPEIANIKLDICYILHIMFPNMKSRYAYTPPDLNHIKHLQTIFKDQLKFTPKDIFNNKVDICRHLSYWINVELFIVYMIKKMDNTIVCNIIRALYQQNNSIFRYDKYVFKTLVRLSKNNIELIKLVNYLWENNIFIEKQYDACIGRLIPSLQYKQLSAKIYL
jgi:hypothetical protein